MSYPINSPPSLLCHVMDLGSALAKGMERSSSALIGGPAGLKENVHLVDSFARETCTTRWRIGCLGNPGGKARETVA